MLLTHYTDCRNIKRIRKERVLRCALGLMNEREKAAYAKKKRDKCQPLASDAVLRDQEPLSEDIVFCDGANLSEYIHYLNQHVFFWPQCSRGKQYRIRFRKKYQYPAHVGLRCTLASLQKANPDAAILFSPYNSGSTPRGDPHQTPRSLCLFKRCKPKRLAEVVIQNKAQLPDDTKWEFEQDKWEPFFID